MCSDGADLTYLATRSSVDAAFEAVEELDLLPGATAVANPVLIHDERVIVFNAVTAADGNQLYAAQRASRAELFGAAVRLDVPSPSTAYNAPFVREDGCELFFTLHNSASGSRDIYRATVE